MANKKGSKLHSIIEKLSEQFVRVNPTEDLNAESPQIVKVTAQSPKQRNPPGNGKRKRPKRSSKAKTNRKSKNPLNNSDKSSSAQHETRSCCQPVDDDLCINVNALMSIVPQLQDIDVVANSSSSDEKVTCDICFKRVKSKEEMLVHLKDTHPEHFHDSRQDNKVANLCEDQEREQDKGFEEFEEEMEESGDEDHSDLDPDFDLDVDSDTDVSSDDMIVPKFDQTRRSARIRAMKGSEGTKFHMSEENKMHSNSQPEPSDLHIDVEKFISTSPKLEDIDLPKTKEFSCKLCEEKYYFQIELDTHFEENHLENSDDNSQSTWNCEHCRKEFFSKKSLLLHINKLVQKIERKEKIQQEKRRKKEKENTCKHCGKICKNYGSLKKHYTTHSDDRPFKCDICNRTFKDKSYVYRHKIIHTGVKKYECKYCKKLFAHSGSLHTHIMLHTGERPFKCQFCETGFISKFDLKVHENKHTGNMPYKCPHCTKSFPKSNNLKVHLISHSTDKPFPCEVCGKAFKRRDHLRYHLIIHSDDKPYKCDTCNKTFNQHVCLRKHLPCRELEKIEKRTNKPKEKNSQKQKMAKKSHVLDKQVSGDSNNATTSTQVMFDQEKQNEHRTENLKLNEQQEIALELPVSYLNTDTTTTTTTTKNSQNTNKGKRNKAKEQIQSVENTQATLASNIINSVTASKEQGYAAESDPSTSNNVDPVLSSTRQSNDSGLGLSSLIDRSCSDTTVRHSSIEKIDFRVNDFRAIPNLGTGSLPIRTFPQPQRLTETCIYTSAVQQPFVPFNCSSQSASGMDYETGGLELDPLPSGGSHSNILGNRSFTHESPSELSSALLVAMDPDNLSAMVESTSAFFTST